MAFGTGRKREDSGKAWWKPRRPEWLWSLVTVPVAVTLTFGVYASGLFGWSLPIACLSLLGAALVAYAGTLFTRRLPLAAAAVVLLLLVCSVYWGGLNIQELLSNIASLFGLVSLLVAGIIATTPGRRWIAVLPLLAAGIWLQPTSGLYGGNPQIVGRPDDMRTELTVGVANLLWFDGANPDKLSALVGEDGPAVLGLVEVSKAWRDEAEERLSEEWPHQVWWPAERSEWDEETWGVGLLSRYPLRDVRRDGPEEAHTRLLRAEVDLGVSSFPFHVLHFPRPGFRPMRAEQRQLWIDWFPSQAFGEDAVLVGDLNTTEGSTLWKTILSSSRLFDSRVGFGVQPSWPRPLADSGVGLGIDHVLVGFTWRVSARETRDLPGSDHRAVVATLAR